jgi:hypothetical protein
MCSLCSRHRILLRGWLAELSDSEGSDNEMRDSVEGTGQKGSRTVKSEVVICDNSGYNSEYPNKSRLNSEPTII